MKFLASVVALSLSYALVFGHSCTTFKNLRDEEYNKKLQEVDSIFSGKVLNVTEKPSQVYLIKFKVTRVWKGVQTSEIEYEYDNPCSSTPPSLNSFPSPESSILYAYYSNNREILSVNCCNPFDDERTKSIYGEGKSLESIQQPTEHQESFWSRIWNKIVSLFQ